MPYTPQCMQTHSNTYHIPVPYTLHVSCYSIHVNAIFSHSIKYVQTVHAAHCISWPGTLDQPRSPQLGWSTSRL